MRAGAVAVTIGFVVSCATLPSRARADEPPPPQQTAPPGTAPATAQFAWVRAQGAESCPDGTVVARDVATRLGRDPFGPEPAQRVEAVVSREAGRWLARVYFRDARGALTGFREIESGAAGCDAISAAATLAIALGIDPNAPPPPPPSPPPPPRPAPAGPDRRADRRTAAPPTPAPPPTGLIRPHGGGIALRGFGILGVQPTVSGGGALAADGLVWGPLRWSAGVFLPLDAHAATPNEDVAFSLVGGWLHACFEFWPVDRLALAGCAGVTAGVLTAHSPIRRTETSAWAGPSAELRVSVTIIGPLFAQAGIQGVLAVAHRAFDIPRPLMPPPPPPTQPPTGIIYDPGILAGIAYLGLGVQF